MIRDVGPALAVLARRARAVVLCRVERFDRVTRTAPGQYVARMALDALLRCPPGACSRCPRF